MAYCLSSSYLPWWVGQLVGDYWPDLAWPGAKGEKCFMRCKCIILKSVDQILYGATCFLPSLGNVVVHAEHIQSFLENRLICGELGEHTLVKYEHDRIILLYRRRENGFEKTFAAEALANVATEAVLGHQFRRAKPAHVVGPVKHVLYDSRLFLDTHRISSEDHFFEHYAIRVDGCEIARGDKLPLARLLLEDQEWRWHETSGAVARGHGEAVRVQKALKLVLVAVQVTLTEVQGEIGKHRGGMEIYIRFRED